MQDARDPAELSFMDSSGLYVLLACARTCDNEGVSVHLAAACGGPARVLSITALDTHLPTYPTME
ncbi:STAS domain-containing protein [Nonomuraea guangzhouensis]|uniref:STAS domain-containing protein n=1 Tax=Nonomuraea guangzhouensis TaxID=1291555 RepID=A0ABW4GUF4_9ACTN|nr:STAS domain-containing protein [Nonomuraea guangzhouensis]